MKKQYSARIKIFSAFLFTLASLNLAASDLNKKDQFYTDKRSAMLQDQIIARGIKDPLVLKAMGAVKRECFIPLGQRVYAYDDGPLPIGYGQTISQPYIVAYMTEALKLKAEDKVLEIGSGSGYQAAVLAEICREVYSMEIVPELEKTAGESLKSQNYKNVKTKVGDGYYGWEEHAPYDAIIVTAAAGNIPKPLLDQLKNGGRMIIPVGSPYLIQHLILLEKNGSDIKTERLIAVRFVPFTRSPEE